MPGLDGTGVLFRPFLAALPAPVQAQVLSYPTHEPLSYAALLPQVRASLPSPEPFVLVAESFSGALSLMVGSEAPRGLQGIVLCASFALNPVSWAPAPLRHLVRGAFLRLVPSSTHVPFLLGRYATSELRGLLRLALSAVQPSVLAFRIREVLAVNAHPYLQACSVPFLCIRPLHDRLVAPKSLQVIRREKPSLQVVSLPAPHLVMQTQPAACVQAIVSFSVSLGVA